MYQLRAYQTEAVERGTRFLRQPGSGGGLIVLPTGAGKSLVIAGIAKQLDQPCLIFQPTREVLEQNANKLVAYGFNPSVYSASLGMREVGSITLATIGSVKDHPELFQQFPYVMVDEAHKVSAKSGMYKDFLDGLYQHHRIIGLTATPYRMSTDGYGGTMLKFLTRTKPAVFEHVLSYAQIPDLVRQGYLVKPQYQIVSGFQRKDVKVNTTGADFDETSLKRYYNRTGFSGRLARVVQRLLDIGRKNVLVFTKFVDEAEALAADLPGVAVLTSETTATERHAIVEAFRSGEIKAVANVGVLGIGFDYPELETVVLARPTLSLALYYQQVGRLLRPHPNKTSAWVVDMVDQVAQFGPVEDLWLQPGGPSGTKWEMVSKSSGQVLTNCYFGDGVSQRRGWSRGRPKGKS